MFGFKKRDAEPDAEFDVERMSVFSIERISRTETTLGFVHYQEVRDFSLVCSVEKHNELVERLRNKLKGA